MITPMTMGHVKVHDELHLTGGLRAGTSKDGHLIFHQSIEGRTINLSKVIDKSRYYEAIKHFGLDFLGHESHAIDGEMIRSDWKTFDAPSHRMDIIDTWSGMSFFAKETGQDAAALLGRKIAFSLRTASLRLRDCSHEYGRQNGIAVRSKVTEGLRFSNLEIFDLYMALHSVLVEMCSARDYLANFVSSQILKLDKNIDSMAGLHKAISSNSTVTSAEHAPLLNEIRNICSRTLKTGWMARLSEYRNIIAHRAPINSLGRR